MRAKNRTAQRFTAASLLPCKASSIGRRYAAAVFLSACLLPARASAQTPLDLRAAVRYALAHSAALATRHATLANDEAQYAKDHANEYPPITGLLQNQLSKQSNASGTLAQYSLAPNAAFSQNIAQIGSQWTIQTGSYNQILAQQARRQVESERADLQRAEQQLVQDVSSAFYSVAQRRQTVELDLSDQAYQRALLDVARNNERVGRIAGVDVLRAQVNALRAGAALATARSDEATARESLAAQIGAPPDQPFAIGDVLPEPPLPSASLEGLIAVAQTNRPDIASATAALARARLSNAIIDTDRFPSLQLSAAFGNQYSPTQLGETVIGPNGGLRTIVPPRGNPGFWQIAATETLQIGLIDYGARHAQHRAAYIGIEAAQTTLDTTRFAVETDVRQALRGAQTAAANLTIAKQASELGAESARIAQLQYKNGLISLTDATQAQRDNISAQSDLVTARVSYINAIVRLRVAVGTGDPIAVVTLSDS